MSITAEEKKKYFAETALALSRAGFHVEEIPDNKLGVWLDEQPLCEVGEVGGITYRSDNISTPERMAAKGCPTVTTLPETMKEPSATLPPVPASSRNSSSSKTSSSSRYTVVVLTPSMQAST